MPFVKRVIEPPKIRKRDNPEEDPFDCHDDVSTVCCKISVKSFSMNKISVKSNQC